MKEQSLFMSGICPVLVRYMFGILADKYRTYSGQVPDNDLR